MHRDGLLFATLLFIISDMESTVKSSLSIEASAQFLSWPVASDHVSTQYTIRIYDYQDGSLNDQSGLFTVHN